MNLGLLRAKFGLGTKMKFAAHKKLYDFHLRAKVIRAIE